MSQFVLDDHLSPDEVYYSITRWATASYLRELRPGEVIKDERVPSILQELKHPTFLSIDLGFWDKNFRGAKYCIIYFALRRDEQQLVSKLLRRLLRLPQFRTRAARMGKVVRVSTVQVEYWELGNEQLQKLSW